MILSPPGHRASSCSGSKQDFGCQRTRALFGYLKQVFDCKNVPHEDFQENSCEDNWSKSGYFVNCLTESLLGTFVVFFFQQATHISYEEFSSNGFVLALIILLSMLLFGIFQQNSFYLSVRQGIRIKAALQVRTIVAAAALRTNNACGHNLANKGYLLPFEKSCATHRAGVVDWFLLYTVFLFGPRVRRWCTRRPCVSPRGCWARGA